MIVQRYAVCYGDAPLLLLPIGDRSYHFIHIIWIYLTLFTTLLTNYNKHLGFRLERAERRGKLEQVGPVVLLALGCLLALFVQLGDLVR